MTTSPRFPILVLAVLSWLGCDRAAERPPAGPAPAPVVAAPVPAPAPVVAAPAPPADPARPVAWPLEVVDGFGRKVVVARPPARIVSLAPSNTELVFAVGAGDKLVGRTTVCTYPPEAASVPTVGGMTPKTIGLEGLVALRPDLILATCGVQEPLMQPLERLGLPVVALDADDFEGVARNLRLVGALTDHAAAGDRLATRFLDRVERVRFAAKMRAHAPAPRVFYLLGEDPLMTAGPQTFIGRMIETAGGTNVFGDVTARYPRPSEEEVIARAPDVILTAVGAMTDASADLAARRARIAARPGWGQIPAVRTGRITFLVEDEVLRPGPRLADGLEAVAAALESVVPKPY